MSPENRGRDRRHLRIQPDPGRVSLREEGSPIPPLASPIPPRAETAGFTEAVVRAGWSMRLHALLGEEVARGVDSGVLTVAEAEVLLARLAVVIDQAVGTNQL